MSGEKTLKKIAEKSFCVFGGFLWAASKHTKTSFGK